MICHYIQDNHNEIRYIRGYRELHTNVLQYEYNLLWDDFLIQQMCNGMYASELFIKVAAVLLGCHIYITSELCAETNPYKSRVARPSTVQGIIACSITARAPDSLE